MAAAAAPAQAQEIEPGHVNVCLEAVPASFAVPRVEPLLEIHVAVVLDDGVTIDEGRDTFEKANRAYAPIGLKLLPTFVHASTTSDDALALFQDLKALFGGERPPWAHVVYLMTKRDITDPSGAGLAGQADCIGGVAFPDTAFAIGEAHDRTETIGPVSFFTHFTAKVAGHEIGHLFGAHHHYANCTEGLATADPADDAMPCTLMSPDVGLMQIRFSTLNSGVVRGHALSYLEPITATPPPDGTRLVKPDLPSCDYRAYVDPAGDQAGLIVTNPDDIDIRSGSFNVEEGRKTVRFRWKLTSLDGDFGVAPSVKYRLAILKPYELRIEALWDGKDQLSAAAYKGAYEGDEMIMPVGVRMTPGPGGTVEVELPLEELGLADQELQLGYAAALTSLDDKVDFDNAQPSIKQPFKPAACGVKTPRIVTSQDADAPPPRPLAPAAKLRLEVLGSTSARKVAKQRRLRVRVTGVARDAKLRLTDARGRTVASGALARVDGARVVALRVTARRLRAGSYTLRLSARGIDQRMGVRLK